MMSRLPELRLQLGAAALSRRRLYLDQRFWNDLCDMSSGSSRDAAEGLECLTSTVAQGSLACPTEATSIAELFNQTLPEKRRITAGLMDHLSAGFTLASPPNRVFLEALNFLRHVSSGPPFPPAPSREMWTRPAFAFGHFELPELEESDSLAGELNRMAEERVWNSTHVELLEVLGTDPPPSFAWTMKMAATLNESKRVARRRFRSYRRLYLSEVRGTLDITVSQLGEAAEYLAMKAGIDVTELSRDKPIDAGTQLAGLIAAGFAKHDLTGTFPSIHILATLVARLQWDEPRKYDPNDFPDFSHTAAALPYCDAFATERSLATLLSDSGLASRYDVTLLTSWADVVSWVSTDNAS